jgi:thioredoxin-related protein
MKTLLHTSSLALLLLILASPHSRGEITFIKGTLATALQKAEAGSKAVMIDFITDWCRWCDTLDARTYSDDDVAHFINANMVAIKIDAEKGEGIEIAKKYGVDAYPTIIITRANGEEIDRILGFVEPEPFLQTVKDYLDNKNTIGEMLKRLAANTDSKEERYAIAKKYVDRYEMKSAAEHFEKLLELDPQNTLGHNEEASHTVAQVALQSAKDPSKLVQFVGDYPSSDRLRQSLSSLFRHYINQKDGANAKAFFIQYMEKWPEDARMMNAYAWNCGEKQINLEHASEVARSAVALATKDEDKAMYLDTYATVQFHLGNLDEAIRIEREALSLMKDAPEKKRKGYEETLARFLAAKEGAAAN